MDTRSPRLVGQAPELRIGNRDTGTQEVGVTETPGKAKVGITVRQGTALATRGFTANSPPLLGRYTVPGGPLLVAAAGGPDLLREFCAMVIW